MATTFDKASLVMIPSGYKDDKLYSIKPTDGSGDFTFSRDGAGASPATRVNASGLIEKGRENLLLQSNTLSNATWIKGSGGTGVSVTGGQSGYDGTSDAWLLAKNAANEALSESISTNGVQTLSIYAKAGTLNWIGLGLGGGSFSSAYFDLQNGTLGTSVQNIITSKIEAIGGGWYRCSVVLNKSVNAIYIYPAEGDGITSGTSGSIYIQDAQLEQGLISTSYIETTTAAVSAGLLGDMPRLDYSGGATCPSLKLEPSRVNLILHSEYTDGTNWSNEGSIVDEENTSETTSPEGVYNAVKLVSANATSEQWIQATGISVTSGSDCTLSCFVKKSDYDYFHIRFTGIGGGFSAGSIWFNIANGTLGTAQSGITGTIEDYGNGWYRISATKEVIGTTANAGVRFQLASSDNTSAVVGDGSKGTYVFGFQAELGSYPTSYIPTYGSASGRAVDACVKTSASDLIGQSEGTLFMDADFVAGNGEDQTILIGVSGYNDYMFIQMNSSNRVEAGIIVNTTEIARIGEIKTSGRYKCAFAYADNDFAFYINGVQIGTDTSGSMSGFAVDFINLNFNNKGYSLNNHLLFKTRLTNAELAALTTL